MRSDRRYSAESAGRTAAESADTGNSFSASIRSGQWHEDEAANPQLDATRHTIAHRSAGFIARIDGARSIATGSRVRSIRNCRFQPLDPPLQETALGVHGPRSWGEWTFIEFRGIRVAAGLTGGGMFSTGDSDATNGVVQELNFKDEDSFRRSALSLFDQLSYLPESSFGFAGTAGAGLPGVGAGGSIG